MNGLKVRITLVLAVVSMVLISFPATALADLKYFPDGNGWGKTYRNNYRSSGCYDEFGSYSSCYQGSWAETFSWQDYVSVAETPQKWVPEIPGNYSGPFYRYQKSAITALGVSDVSVSSDYDALFDHRVDIAQPTSNQDTDKMWYVGTYDE